MENIKQIIGECAFSFSDVQRDFKHLYLSIFDQESKWLTNVEEKTYLLSNKIKIDIDYIILMLKDVDYEFIEKDTVQLATFTANINSIIKITNRINNFKEGTILESGNQLCLFELFNSIKKTSQFKDLRLDLNRNLKSFIVHLFSIIKHCQKPNEYPIYYKYWKNILGEVLRKKNDYDSLCEFYSGVSEPRHLSLGAYFGVIGTILAEKVSKNNLIKEKNDRNYKIIRRIINIHYFDLIKGYKKDFMNYEVHFTKWLKDRSVEGSNKVSSYLKAIKILSELLGENLFEKKDLTDLTSLYVDLVADQKNDEGKYYYPQAPSYGQSGFYSASINAYIDFIKSLSLDEDGEDAVVDSTRVINSLAQAICVVGDSGVGKTYRVNKTLEYDGHKALNVIVDNMWQHILFDYSPEKKEYCLTKVSEFIKKAVHDKENYYTIVFDECHKNLEIINDVLLQAISTKRNDGIRFFSLNSLVDDKFDFLIELNGNRILPENLGFVFISSKSDIIEGNDDLRNRIEIVELSLSDKADEDYSIEYLLRKIKKVEQGDYTN